MRPHCGNATHTGPTVIEAQFYLTQVNKIDQKLSHLTLNGYFRTWWKDPRLAFNDKAHGGCFDIISMNGDEADAIWMPDIYIDNLVQKTTDGGFSKLTQVSPDGSVWRSEQVLIKVKSALDLGKLPYDSHVAKIVLASYSQDVTQLRLMARGGTIGAGVSGTGLVAPKMDSSVWMFLNDETEDPDDGFDTKGEVEIFFSGSWDYLTLSFPYTRKAKFFTDTVIVPTVLFLCISYIQFFVDPSITPARASIAVLPVLILVLLSNAVYRSLPEGSQRMWLTEFLMTAMMFAVGAAAEFAMVQAFQMREKGREAQRTGLVKVRPIAERLMDRCEKDKVTLFSLLTRYAAVDVEGSMRAAAPDAKEHGLKEADLSFILYAHQVFAVYDKDGSNNLSVTEVRKAFNAFNIYRSRQTMGKIICMFLRDRGLSTPLDENKVKLPFKDFALLLMMINQYDLATPPAGGILSRMIEYMQSIAPSHRADTTCRILFPVAVLAMIVGFELARPAF